MNKIFIALCIIYIVMGIGITIAIKTDEVENSMKHKNALLLFLLWPLLCGGVAE